MSSIQSIVFDFQGVLLDLETRTIKNEMLELLQELNDLDLKLYIFSNTGRERVETYDQKYHFLKFFDKAIYPNEVGYSKPSNEAFKFFFNSVGIIPQETVFVDDNLNNLRQGENYGMIGIKYINVDRLRISLVSLDTIY